MFNNNVNGESTIVNTNRKKTKFEIVMYVAAIVMLVFAAFMIWSSVVYIKSYYSSYGMSISEGLKDAIQYILSNSATWIVYALIFFGMARITARLENIKAYPRKIKIQKNNFAQAQASQIAAESENQKNAAPETDTEKTDTKETNTDEIAFSDDDAANK